mmetsp:Transcript_10117/g.29922  ORF Transcript_10117/g.29922 Transcript_10117/m.29922 type:complete len:362 (+) Transcript_10117:147-1232(+)
MISSADHVHYELPVPARTRLCGDANHLRDWLAAHRAAVAAVRAPALFRARVAHPSVAAFEEDGLAGPAFADPAHVGLGIGLAIFLLVVHELVGCDDVSILTAARASCVHECTWVLRRAERVTQVRQVLGRWSVRVGGGRVGEQALLSFVQRGALPDQLLWLDSATHHLLQADRRFIQLPLTRVLVLHDHNDGQAHPDEEGARGRRGEEVEGGARVHGAAILVEPEPDVYAAHESAGPAQDCKESDDHHDGPQDTLRRAAPLCGREAHEEGREAAGEHDHPHAQRTEAQPQGPERAHPRGLLVGGDTVQLACDCYGKEVGHPYAQAKVGTRALFGRSGRALEKARDHAHEHGHVDRRADEAD